MADIHLPPVAHNEYEHISATLHECEESLHTFFSNAPIILWALDREGVVIFSDGCGLSSLGFKPGELVGRSVFDLYSDIPVVLETCKLALEGKRVDSVVDINGCILDSRCTPLYDHQRNCIGTIGVAIDITERDQDEETLCRLHTELESRILERAAELARLGRAMQTEIAECKQAERLAHEQMNSLTRNLRLLTSTSDMQTFFSQLLITIAQHLGVDSGTLWFNDLSNGIARKYIDYDRDKSKSLSPIDSSSEFRCNYPSLQKRATGLNSLLFTNISDHPTLAPIRDHLASKGSKTIFSVPLILGDEIIGWITLRSRETRKYPAEELEFVRTLAQQAALAVHLTRLAEQNRQPTVLEEQHRLTQDIHDTLAQALISVVRQVETAQECLKTDPQSIQMHIVRAGEVAREGLAEARRTLKSLQTQTPEDKGLPTLLSQIADQITFGTSIQIQSRIQGDPYPLSTETERHLMFICQEALMNAIKHADPNVLQIQLSYTSEHVKLCLWDDGCGFVYRALDRCEGTGIPSMHERAKRLGGTLTICSLPGQGTEVTALIPNILG